MTITFSTTKAVTAVVMAKLVEMGRLSYSDPVSIHWPGFGKHGKENVTVQQVLSHQVSVHYPVNLLLISLDSRISIRQSHWRWRDIMN